MRDPASDSEPRFRAVAFLDEVLGTPDLLIDFARVFAGRRDAELVVHAPAFVGAESYLADELAPIAAELGLDQEGSARVVIVTEPTREQLAEGAAAVYTRSTAVDGLPSVASAEELYALADAPERPAPQRFVSVAFLEEIGEAPDLLAEYARVFHDVPSATLFVLAPDADPALLERELGNVARAMGLDADGSADVVVLTDSDGAEKLAPITSALYTRVARNGCFAKTPQLGDADALLRFAAENETVSALDSDYARRLEREQRVFDNRVVVHDLPEIYHYWSNEHLLPKFEAVGLAGIDDFFVDQIAAAADRNGGSADVISLGAGNCEPEIRLLEALESRGYTDVRFHCLDISTQALERGQELAAERGRADSIVPVVADLNTWRPAIAYDAVLAVHALHHFVELETILGAVREALVQRNGVFLVNDMIGRNGHLRWPEAEAVVQELWQELPDRCKWNHQLQRHEPVFEDWDCSTDGFEGIRAQDILPLINERFEAETFLAFANVIDVFVDRSFGPNFDANDPADRAFIDKVAQLDDELIDRGVVKPTHVIASFRPTATSALRAYRHWTPEFSVRRVSWLSSKTLGGPDASMPERAYPGMQYADVMSEHAIRYGWASGLVAGLDVLDLGCGTGYGSEILTWTSSRVRGFDLWRPGTAETPQWPGGADLSFGHDLCTGALPKADAAVMFEVLEHLDDAPAALRSAWASVDTLVVSFPNPVYHGSHHNHHHVNDWPLERVETELRAAADAPLELTHLHQEQGLILPGRDDEASYWLLVARKQNVMKQEWDARARENAMYFIASGKDDWDEREFSESGRDNVEQYVVADRALICGDRDPKSMRALDIGCGIGRLTEHLGRFFGEAAGVDVSGEMIRRGVERLAAKPNVTLVEGNGTDLPFADESFDFVFSYIVFQHVPTKQAVIGNLRDAYRVLAPGSIFKFQVQGSQNPHYVAAQKDTWHGVTFSEQEMRALAAEIGFEPLKSEGAGTQYFWHWWRKSA